MLTVEARLFFNSGPSTNDRVLVPATVTAVEGLTITAELDVPEIRLNDGAEAEIFFERTRKFVQQEVRIKSAHTDDGPMTITFIAEGEPEVVEQRQQYRVMTILEGLDVALNTEAARLADVSGCGFSSIGNGKHAIGETLNATVGVGRKRYSGQATLQSVKELPTGEHRYGFIVSRSERELRDGLQQILMDTQRKQLRRRRAA